MSGEWNNVKREPLSEMRKIMKEHDTSIEAGMKLDFGFRILGKSIPTQTPNPKPQTPAFDNMN
ncbi:MAG: hypothetical protein C0601_11830 [Candidatus Muiribacterium halophilum]|uniref:Uncharacterized protein n=1 Tax=Muiribacterium halophilum TaxID=2053465 RepID=A0A2N5ZB83_MUIH1|nr:MAG: hypothetical protein C0601_11830 [Candidatus Muirbacterium halophilum]